MLVDGNREVVYRQGYDRALSDVRNWFDNHTMSLKRDKMYSQNGIRMVLNALADNSERLSEDGRDLELFYNKNEKKLRAVKDCVSLRELTMR